MTTAAFGLALALVVAGFGLIYLPAGLIVAGVLVAAGAVAVERAAS